MDFLTRLLKFIIALMLVAAVFFWFAARRGDRGNIEEEITVDRSAPVVFRWFTDDDRLRRWIGDLSRLENISPAGSNAALNKQMKIEETIAGRSYVFDLKATQLVPNQLMVWEIQCADPAGCRGRAEVKLLPSGDYTRVVFSSHTEFFALGDRILEPILTYGVRRKLHNDFFRLKLLAEAEDPAAPEPRAR